jgi:hypothetical protein
VGHVSTTPVKQLQNIVQARGVAAALVYNRKEILDVFLVESAFERVLSGAHLPDIPLNGVYLTVVREEPKRL